MRKGQNPVKRMGLLASQPSQLGVLLLVYIPIQSGYFKNALDIFKYQLASLHKNTSQAFDLLVWDNGSCQAVQDTLQKLQTEGWIDWLTLSHNNIGKTGVMNWGFRAMPNEIICYSDGDAYFRPGWYEQSLRILNTFPQTGMVTAQPCFFDSLAGKGQAHLPLQSMTQYVTSTRPADQTALDEYIHSIGDVNEIRPRYHEHTWQIISDPASGVEAVIGASHFQFLAYKSLLEQITPFPVTYGLNRKDDYHIISRIDQLGYLQLSTLNPYVYHMGNVPDEITLEDVRRDGLKDIFLDNPAITVTDQHDHRSWRKNISLKALRSISSIGFFRDLLLRIYNLLFEHFTSPK